ncbi:MAG: hypothetical protein A2X49_14590 [Lentisphaerae bacterium GWF2_52_8]|nr:MAG: hypothetical protein A2X49_14590 [Lentisphaerae bacterium GWF2_52_8]
MITEKLRHGIIVSCQAIKGNPLYNTGNMPLMALCAEKGGAAGIRANGPQDISEIKKICSLPVIGIYKTEASKDEIYITPSFEHAESIAKAGSDIIALDATFRRRPSGITTAELVRKIHGELQLPVMADISNFDEGVQAAKDGCDIIATTMAGYTSYTKVSDGPDFELLKNLCSKLECPVIAEGRFWHPEELNKAFELGAWAVVIGKAITNPMAITKHFVSKLKT